MMGNSFVESLARLESGTDDHLCRDIMSTRVIIDTGGVSPKGAGKIQLCTWMANRFRSIAQSEIEIVVAQLGDFELVSRLLWTAERLGRTPSSVLARVGLPRQTRCDQRGHHYFIGEADTCVDCGDRPDQYTPDVASVGPDLPPEPPAQWVLQEAIDAADAEFGPEAVNPG